MPMDELTPQQEQAVLALLTEPTLGAVCQKVDTSYPTLRHWLRQPAFQAEYRRARREVIEHVLGRLQRGMVKALETLERNMECGSPAVEVRAAAAMGELAMRASEQLDFEARLRQVEDAYAAVQDPSDAAPSRCIASGRRLYHEDEDGGQWLTVQGTECPASVE